MDLELKGKAAIVTGGNRGIGKAIALELAKEGVNVAIVARDKAALESAAAGDRRAAAASRCCSSAPTPATTRR